MSGCICCTQRLLVEFNVKRKVLANPTSAPLSTWYANIVRLERRKCVVVINQETAYVTVFPFVDRKTIQAIPQLLPSEISRRMQADGFGQEVIERFVAPLSDPVLSRTCNRSVLGFLDQATLHVGYGFDWLIEHGVQPSGMELAAYLNEMPFGGRFPVVQLARQLGVDVPKRRPSFQPY